jgi:hypothetical protein
MRGSRNGSRFAPRDEVPGKLLSDGVGVDKGTEQDLALIGCPVTDCGRLCMLDPGQKPSLPDRRGGLTYRIDQPVFGLNRLQPNCMVTCRDTWPVIRHR